MESDLVKKSLSANVAFLKLGGLFPYSSCPKIYPLYAYLMYALFTLPVPILVTVEFFMVKEIDKNKFTENFFLTLQMAVLILKLPPVKNNPKRTLRNMEWLNAGIFRKHSLGHEEMVEECARECKRNFYLLLFFCLASTFSWPLKLLFREERVLLLEMWLPFNPLEDSRVYWAVFAFILLGVVNASIDNASVDTLITGLIHHAATQLKILKNNLENLFGTVENQLSTESESLSDAERDQLRARMTYAEICGCIDHYDAISNFVKDLEESYSFVVFPSFIGSMIVLCISCFQLSVVEPFTVTFFAMIIFTGTVAIEIFLFCYYGMVLYEESDTVINSIYMSDWYNFDAKSKKALITLMERAKRPMLVTAGKILDLSLETFAMVIRRSYSLLAVLKN